MNPTSHHSSSSQASTRDRGNTATDESRLVRADLDDVLDQDGGSDSKNTPRTLLELQGIDLDSIVHSREEIERVIPHRGAMSLLDAIVWESADYKRGIGMINVSSDAFWVPGHFPGHAMLPGVLMVEAGAQLACYLYNRRQPEPKVVAFLRIENAVFRAMVTPGDRFYVLCREVKFAKRRFISDIQGIVGGRVAFDARISGMRLSASASGDISE